MKLRCLLCGQKFEAASDLEAIRLLNQHTLEQHTGNAAPPDAAPDGGAHPPPSG